MSTLTAPRHHARFVPLARAGAPKGPTGLWDALASASAPRITARALPVSDVALLGSVTSAMFDYDPAAAVPLGELVDPSVLLG